MGSSFYLSKAPPLSFLLLLLLLLLTSLQSLAKSKKLHYFETFLLRININIIITKGFWQRVDLDRRGEHQHINEPVMNGKRKGKNIELDKQ